MTGKPNTAAAATDSPSGAWERVKGLFGRRGGVDTSEVWTLFRMARGSDSVRPSVIRKLAANAAR